MERVEPFEGKVVVFGVGGQEYALPIAVVREIIPWTEPTPVPESPPFVPGVISVRGDVLPVVDMARRFGLARQKREEESCIIIVDVDGQQAGLVVDDVVAVETAAPTAVVQRTSLLGAVGGAGETVVDGVLKLGESRLVVLLDASRVAQV
ncbi:MAG: chemotaxis protein CheW [Symbiobacterium sp.]|uniref:chemotaxis protein CheW n=1 Tax=Symbiobacterium sp. TaxID=1971213 RepID=UPI003463A5ED